MKRHRTKARDDVAKFLALSPAERDEATREFDREFIADTFEPLTPEMAARWERAKRKRGRPRVGAGSKPISVTVEQSLLREVDRIARRRKTTRARLIARGLKIVVEAERRAAG